MSNLINVEMYLNLVDNGAKALALDMDRINALNVFPVPDGDTGSNMTMTINGGAKAAKDMNETSLDSFSSKIARAMVLSARGNSGVILSQFFKGVSIGFEGLNDTDVLGLANAFVAGYKKSYSVVQNPTEGTILTVMRESADKALAEIDENTSLTEYFEILIKHANVSLANTPNLLPVLKEANVIDSGGAGYIRVLEGMLAASKGEIIDASMLKEMNTTAVNTSTFNADSELTYGYCTEFILQLQNSKVDTKTFDLDIITSYLETMGNSIVSFKDDDIVKVHVHTFDPGLVLNEMRKYGEFLTIKIENMNVQHSETDLATEANTSKKGERKKYAMVAVANGSGLIDTFKEMGVDVVVSGGQTMNTSTQDFIDAFDTINASNILVFPNNGNIKMAAKQAAENYNDANVIVIPTSTIAEGYSVISMLNLDAELEEIINDANAELENVNTLEVTYSIRDCVMNGVDVKKDDYICLYNDKLIAANPNRLEAVKAAIDNIEDFGDMSVMTLLCGKGVDNSEVAELESYASSKNKYIEVYPVGGEQEIYSYIVGLE